MKMCQFGLFCPFLWAAASNTLVFLYTSSFYIKLSDSLCPACELCLILEMGSWILDPCFQSGEVPKQIKIRVPCSSVLSHSVTEAKSRQSEVDFFWWGLQSPTRHTRKAKPCTGKIFTGFTGRRGRGEVCLPCQQHGAVGPQQDLGSLRNLQNWKSAQHPPHTVVFLCGKDDSVCTYRLIYWVCLPKSKDFVLKGFHYKLPSMYLRSQFAFIDRLFLESWVETGGVLWGEE